MCADNAFGSLHVSKQPDAAVAVLHNHVLPFYEKLDLAVDLGQDVLAPGVSDVALGGEVGRSAGQLSMALMSSRTLAKLPSRTTSAVRSRMR